MADGLTVGEQAPDFTLPTDGGGTITLSSLRGGKVVVFFYPKDDTSGCTREALDFTAEAAAFAAAGATVIGVSRDSVRSHDAFKAKHGLAVTLASDVDGAVCQAFGVWVEKSLYGRRYMGVDRTTFLIGPDGRISQVWRKVKVPGHVDAVLKALRS
jgi:thioredoxin-dependent peroxiredoxin